MSEQLVHEAIQIIVTGRVQGVSFRYFTQQIAKDLGVVGWVRNLPDATVQIWAEAPPETLERFIECVRQGPPLAMVRDLDVEKFRVSGKYATFELRF